MDRHRLGDPVAELSLVSRTGLFDVVDRVPWQATLDLVGDLLPDRITVAGEACGMATRVPSSMQGAVLTATGMDHQSAAFACGAATTGALFDSMGTAEAFLRFTPGPLSREELIRLSERDVAVLWSVIPDHVCVLGALVTGLSLERVRRLLGIESFGDRAALAEQAVAADRGQLRVNEVDHTGLSLVGVDDDASPAALWRASVMDPSRRAATFWPSRPAAARDGEQCSQVAGCTTRWSCTRMGSHRGLRGQRGRRSRRPGSIDVRRDCRGSNGATGS